jgi:antirestriction protein
MKVSNLTLDEMAVYVGTYAKYNEGSIDGEWVKLSDFSDFDEFLDHIKELHSDEKDPEFMFQDFEVLEIFESMGLISESHISREIFEVIEALKNASYDPEIYSLYASHVGFKGDIESLISDCDEAYAGEFDSDEDFAYDFADQIGELDKNLSWPHSFIDWERAARDLMYDYFSADGHYFRSM